MFGELNQRQASALTAIISGKRVWDLGSGRGCLSVELCRLGAASVVAVDTREPDVTFEGYPIEFKRCTFAELGSPDMSAAFLSWPINRPLSWPELLEAAEVVVFLGQTTGGSMCASESFWKTMQCRPLISVHIDMTNDMLVWGPSTGEPRSWEALHVVEKAGVDYSRMYTHERVK